MAITSLTLSSMCSCTWLQSLAPPPPPPPPPRLSVCCYSSTQLSIHKTLTHIHSSGVIVCLRANSAELALKIARAALSGGISVVLQQLVQEHPTTTLGDIMVDAQCGEVLYIPGVMTPTEILSAYDSGAEIVKSGPHVGFRHEASQDHGHHAGFEKVARLLKLLEEESAKSLLQGIHEYTYER